MSCGCGCGNVNKLAQAKSYVASTNSRGVLRVEKQLGKALWKVYDVATDEEVLMFTKLCQAKEKIEAYLASL